MNEFPAYPSIEQLSSITALNRLDQELVAVDDSRRIVKLMGKYIADEFSLTDVDAIAVAKTVGRAVSSLTSDGLTEGLCMESEEAWRLSIFTDIMPLYQTDHTVAEYKEWLPNALDVVLPESGNHGIHANCHQVHDDVVCHIDNPCPLKMLVAETTRLCLRPDFASFGYIIKNEDMRKDMMILLAELGERGIISKIQQHQLTSEYVENYYQTFSVSR